MDPNQNLREIIEICCTGEGLDRLADLCVGLELWLEGGGFKPDLATAIGDWLNEGRFG